MTPTSYNPKLSKSYRRERAAAARQSALAKAIHMPFGYKIQDRSAIRLWQRGMLLLVLFVPVAIWTVIRRSDDTTEESHLGGRTPLARRLGPNPTGTLGPSYGYDCLTKDEYDDKKENTLKVVTAGTTMRDCRSKAGPCLKKGKEWLIIFYLPLMFYMFVALAIVCDEFFVPALEAFVEHYQIDMDIAGATFMAAGGSMPELFTSIFAVFDKSDVGFAAIVGSAVFNVLFVIAVCALASDNPLELTAWPLTRDCSFYLVALSLIVIFFSGSSPKEIEWWEALILFIWYLCYCSFMTVNEKAKNLFDKLRGASSPQKVHPEPQAGQDPGRMVPMDGKRMATANLNMRMPSKFRSGVIKLLTQHARMEETAGITVVTQMKGNLRDAFNEMDEDGDGHITEAEFNVFMQRLGWQPPSDDEIRDIKEDAASKLWKRMPLSDGDTLAFEDFRKWYTVSEARMEIEVRRVFDSLDTNKDQMVDKDEIIMLLNGLDHRPTQAELGEVLNDIARFSNPGGDELTAEEIRTFKVSFVQFEKWYTQSLFCEAHHRKHQIESTEDDGFTIEWPEDATNWQIFWYIFTYPLCAAMWCSLPDVRKTEYEGKVHWAIIEFVLSLGWIALFALLLYESTLITSNTMGIPPPVAAVTILAAGTSVPDLISSYIVARQGQGDMAVSSSIGSNIFDVTVGLPIPWMLFSFINNMDNVKVQTTSLGFSVLVLILMLVCVLLTIILMNWRMTRGLGGVMFGLYFVFLVLDLLQQLPQDNPTLKTF